MIFKWVVYIAFGTSIYWDLIDSVSVVISRMGSLTGGIHCRCIPSFLESFSVMLSPTFNTIKWPCTLCFRVHVNLKTWILYTMTFFLSGSTLILLCSKYSKLFYLFCGSSPTKNNGRGYLLTLFLTLMIFLTLWLFFQFIFILESGIEWCTIPSPWTCWISFQ